MPDAPSLPNLSLHSSMGGVAQLDADNLHKVSQSVLWVFGLHFAQDFFVCIALSDTTPIRECGYPSEPNNFLPQTPGICVLAFKTWDFFCVCFLMTNETLQMLVLRRRKEELPMHRDLIGPMGRTSSSPESLYQTSRLGYSFCQTEALALDYAKCAQEFN